MKALGCVLALALAGCATCDRHPTACNVVIVGVGAAVIVGLSAHEWTGGGCVHNCNLQRPAATP